MSVQWTVSFEKSELNETGLEILAEFEHVVYKETRVDMEEGEFFNFKEQLSHFGVDTLAEDGSGSWGKHV